jgi:hypothetical protein
MSKIELACDHAESDEFVTFLKARGHEVTVGSTTGNYVDGKWTSDDEEANDTLNRLWVAYCHS